MSLTDYGECSMPISKKDTDTPSGYRTLRCRQEVSANFLKSDVTKKGSKTIFRKFMALSREA